MLGLIGKLVSGNNILQKVKKILVNNYFYSEEHSESNYDQIKDSFKSHC